VHDNGKPIHIQAETAIPLLIDLNWSGRFIIAIDTTAAASLFPQLDDRPPATGRLQRVPSYMDKQHF
jgi:hypothetical protein